MTSPWTPDDDAHLFASASTQTAAQIGRTLGRTPRAVYTRARKRGVRLAAARKAVVPVNKNRERAAALLRALSEGPSTTAELATATGETVQLTFGALQRLERSGQVRRKPMPTNNRSRHYLWSLP